MKGVLDVAILVLVLAACWCFSAMFVTAFYIALILLAVAVIWRGYYSYTEPRDPVELDCGFGDTVFGRPEPVHAPLPFTVIEGGDERRPVWPNEIGGIE